MLEWMHDESVVEYLSANFAAKTIDDCKSFINNSQTDVKNLNLAVSDENDEYMGTVSLKHIDMEEGTAEFAITFRTCAMGKGYSRFGMVSILKKGIEELGLKAIYWCVSPDNARAVRFYDKNGYVRVLDVPSNIKSNYSPELPLIWYVYGE